MNATTLFLGVLFGSIGLGLFLYGRKQRAIVPAVCGIALMIYPYFMPNVFALIAVGVVLSGIPYFFRL